MQILTEEFFYSLQTYAPLKFELHFDKIISSLLFRNVLKSVEQWLALSPHGKKAVIESTDWGLWYVGSSPQSKDMHVWSTGDWTGFR